MNLDFYLNFLKVITACTESELLSEMVRIFDPTSTFFSPESIFSESYPEFMETGYWLGLKTIK